MDQKADGKAPEAMTKLLLSLILAFSFLLLKCSSVVAAEALQCSLKYVTHLGLCAIGYI